MHRIGCLPCVSVQECKHFSFLLVPHLPAFLASQVGGILILICIKENHAGINVIIDKHQVVTTWKYSLQPSIYLDKLVHPCINDTDEQKQKEIENACKLYPLIKHRNIIIYSRFRLMEIVNAIDAINVLFSCLQICVSVYQDTRIIMSSCMHSSILKLNLSHCYTREQADSSDEEMKFQWQSMQMESC